MSAGKRPVEISKFLESVRVCTHNFEKSNYGITVNDYYWYSKNGCVPSLLFYEPPLYKMDDLDKACAVSKKIEWKE